MCVCTCLAMPLSLFKTHSRIIFFSIFFINTNWAFIFIFRDGIAGHWKVRCRWFTLQDLYSCCLSYLLTIGWNLLLICPGECLFIRYTYTHIDTHRHTHTHMHTHVHTRNICLGTRTQVHRHTRAQAHRYIFTCFNLFPHRVCTYA